jgi:hypothetical protein
MPGDNNRKSAIAEITATNINVPCIVNLALNLKTRLVKNTINIRD